MKPTEPIITSHVNKSDGNIHGFSVLLLGNNSFYMERIMGRKANEIKIGDMNGLSVIRRILDIPNKKNSLWECKCACGNVITCTGSSLRNGQKGCYDCRAKNISISRYRGCEELSMDFWTTIQSSARARNIEFNLSIEFAWNLYISQDKKCALSKVDITFARGKLNRANTTASLDRIDSSRAYTEGNVQWVHKIVNRMKGILPDSEFIAWCKSIADNN